jgi:two-component system sensor histidine kinase PilS (NtrC family)
MKSINVDIGLKSSVVLRVIIATVLLGSGAIIYFGNGLENEAFFLVLIVAFVYFLSLFYLLLQSFFERYPNLFMGIQIAIDLVLASAAISITGGRTSPFIFLYAIIIIFTSIMFSRTASFITAASAGILYILVALYQFFFHSNGALLSLPPMILGGKGVVYTYFNLVGLLLIAILSGYLSERIRITRKELGESMKSLNILKNLHENILQSLTSGVITLDLQGKIISVNKTGLEILGINGEDKKILGNDLSYLMPGLELRDFVSKKREQISYPTSDGRTLTLGFSSSVLRDTEGEKRGYIIIFQDLTEVKELEDRLRTSEKMALLGQLAAGLAHEIRNPLSAISGAIEILGGEVKPSGENLRLLRVATQEVERLNLLVEDFLLLTTQTQRFTTLVDIGEIIHETVELFSRTMRRSEIEVVMDVQKGIYIQADSYKLKQVVWNLLLNAMQAMPNGGKIVIESYLEHDNIVIKISDNGCGIDKEIIPRIFEPFFTTKEIGTGLGLAIVQKVIEGYNGKIDVTSSKGKGTTFVITLPKVKRVVEGAVY